MSYVVSVKLFDCSHLVSLLIGGGFEGDMIFPKGFNPLSSSEPKGVATYWPRQWPNGIIPYDISAITCKYHYQIGLNFS